MPAGLTAAEDNPFAVLLAACKWCGRFPERRPCPDCGAAETAMPPLPPLIGRSVSWRAGLRRQSGVVVGAVGEVLRVLREDGQSAEIPSQRCREEAAAPGADGVRTVHGAFLAAAIGLGASDWTRSQLYQRAVDFTGAPPDYRRAAAEDFAFLGQADPIRAAGLEAASTAWLTALVMWRAGRVAEAVRAMIALPAGRFPQRLALWTKAVESGQVPDDASEALAAAVRSFDRSHPAVGAAATALLHRLGAAPEHEEVVNAFNALIPDPSVLYAERRRPAAGLLRLLERGGEADPDLLEHATEPYLDALVDAGRVPPSWTDHSRYLRGRVDVASLSDAELGAAGAHAERARRAVLAGKALPGDLPDDVKARFGLLARAKRGDAAAITELASAAGFDDEELRKALDGKELPSQALLEDPSLASLLLEGVDVSAAIEADDAEGPQADFAARLLLRRTRAQLYQWDWNGAYRTGLHVLRLCRTERYRDEAQSLMAAALWQLEEDHAALAALESALKGDYSAALQANLAVVAEHLEPELAAEHLSRMVAEAPKLELRVAAGVHAARIWQASDPSARGADVPESVLRAVRPILFEPMGYEDFTDLVRLAAQHDGDWLDGQRAALRSSPHADSVAAKVWTGLVSSLDDFVKAIAAELRRPEPERWVVDLGGSLAQQAQSLMAQTGGIEGAGLALALLKHRMPMEPVQCAILFGVSFDLVLAQVDPMRGELSPELIDAAHYADESAAALEVDPRLRSMVQELLARVANSFVISRTVQLNEILDKLWPVQSYGHAATPRAPLEIQDVRRLQYLGGMVTYQGKTIVIRFLDDTTRLMEQVASLAYDQSVLRRLRQLQDACHQVRKKI